MLRKVKQKSIVNDFGKVDNSLLRMEQVLWYTWWGEPCSATDPWPGMK